MAVCERSSEGDCPREKIMKTRNKKDKKQYLVDHELKLARVLSGNSKTARDRALKSLKNWFSHRSKTLPFTDNDFEVIWNGLFYSMWMADKPLTQEQCAENIASLIHFQTVDESLLFFKAGLTTLIREWFGIDQLRLDKFLMLVRRLLRQMLVALKEHSLSKKNIDKFGEVLSSTVLNPEDRPSVGLFMHFTEIFLEELAKVTKGNMSSDRVVDFIRPFIKKLGSSEDIREIAHIKKFIFKYLIKQSNLGLEYQAKYDAWKNLGFPGTINSMQKVKVENEEEASANEDSEHNTEERPLDPRAGRVNVELPQIQFKAKDLTNALLKYKFDKNTNTKSRNAMKELIDNFTVMSKGVYPLGVRRVVKIEKNSDTSIRKATNRLLKFENKLMGREKKTKRKRSSEEQPETELPLKRTKVDLIMVKQEPVDGVEDSPKRIDHLHINEKNKRKGKHPRENKINVTRIKEEPVESMENMPRVIHNAKNLCIDNKGDKKKVKNKMKDKITEITDVEPVQDGRNQTKPKVKRKRERSLDKKQSKKKKNSGKPQAIIDNIECVFERNSGTWVVYDLSRTWEETETPSQKTDVHKWESTATSANVELDCSSAPPKRPRGSESVKKNCERSNTGQETPSQDKALPLQSPTEQGSPKSGQSPVHLFESPQKTKDLFPKSSWDEPLQEGEYEICIPWKEQKAEKKKQVQKANQNLHEVLKTPMKQIRGKLRASLDASLQRNLLSTPGSVKKVKINTKLNRSQEIHEHVQQILSSPGIPYDASKKPLKPLLKTPATSTPVNPFYNKQLYVW